MTCIYIVPDTYSHVTCIYVVPDTYSHVTCIKKTNCVQASPLTPIHLHERLQPLGNRNDN